MPDIQVALDEVVTLLTEQGVAAGCDTSKLNPPCAWVHADSYAPDTLDGGGILTSFIDLVVPAWKYPQVMEALSSMLDATLAVLSPDGSVDTDVAVELSGGKILPAFRIPIDLEIKPDKETHP